MKRAIRAFLEVGFLLGFAAAVIHESWPSAAVFGLLVLVQSIEKVERAIDDISLSATVEVPPRVLTGGPVEPSADVREGAQALRQVYVALIAQGFTEQQAIKVTSDMARGARS